MRAPGKTYPFFLLYDHRAIATINSTPTSQPDINPSANGGMVNVISSSLFLYWWYNVQVDEQLRQLHKSQQTDRGYYRLP